MFFFDRSGKPAAFYPISLLNLSFVLKMLSRDISVSFRVTTIADIKL